MAFLCEFHWVMVSLVQTIHAADDAARAQPAASSALPLSLTDPPVPMAGSAQASAHAPGQPLQAPAGASTAGVGAGQDWDAAADAAMRTPVAATSAEADAMQSDMLPALGSGSGTAAAAAAMVQELNVSSRGSPEGVNGMRDAAANAMAVAPAVQQQQQQLAAMAVAASAGAAGGQGQGDVEMASPEHATPTAATADRHGPAPVPMTVGTDPAPAQVGPALAGDTPMTPKQHQHQALPPPQQQASVPATLLSPEALTCVVSLLVRMACDAGRLWDCSGELQQLAGDGTGTAAAAAMLAHRTQNACESAGRLVHKSLVTLAKLLLGQPGLMQAFLTDSRCAQRSNQNVD